MRKGGQFDPPRIFMRPVLRFLHGEVHAWAWFRLGRVKLRSVKLRLRGVAIWMKRCEVTWFEVPRL